MTTITEIDVLEERDSQLPPEYLIMNAYRPIYGHRYWIGEPRRGTHYAAVLPDDGQLIAENIRNDAVLLRYITMQTIREWAQELANREGYIMDDCTEQDLTQMYYGAGHGTRVVEI